MDAKSSLVETVREMFCITTLAYEPSTVIAGNIDTTIDHVKYASELSANPYFGFLAHKFKNARVVLFIDDSATGLQCALTVNHERRRICLVFRGTESFVDVAKDLLFCKATLHEDMQVHRGFASILTSTNYQAVRDDFIRLAALHPDYALYTTGHSLGGALATLAAYLIVQDGGPTERILHVVSFGSPRVGNKEWQASFDSHPRLTHTRVTHKKDIITSLPYLGYYHTGRELHMDGPTWTDKGYTDPMYMACLYRYSFGDHRCASYYRSVFANTNVLVLEEAV